MNRLAPSTMYLKCSADCGTDTLPSSSCSPVMPLTSISLCTLFSVTLLGRPPQGTKVSARTCLEKWNSVMNCSPSTTVPSGSFTFFASIGTNAPSFDSRFLL